MSAKSPRDLDKNYDKYYEGGEDSLYNKGRFKDGNEIALSEEETLRDAIIFSLDRLHEKHADAAIFFNKAGELERRTSPLKLKILEFGCGDGRFFNAIREVAKVLCNNGIEIEIMAYDITEGGLLEYGRRIEQSFGVTAEMDFSEKPVTEDSRPFILGKYEVENLTVNLVKGNLDTQPEQIAEVIGSVDTTLALFGPIAHIRPQEKRVEFLRMFRDITKGSVAITVPSDGQFKKHQEAYKMVRDHGHLPNHEDGDISYKVAGSDIVNDYHVFSERELEESFRQAGYQDDEFKIFISTINNSTRISQNTLVNHTDFVCAQILSSVLPKDSLSPRASYLGVMATSPNQKHHKPSSAFEPDETTALLDKPITTSKKFL